MMAEIIEEVFRDEDTVRKEERMTVGGLCEMMGVAVPDAFDLERDCIILGVSGSVKTTMPGYVYFANGTSENYRKNVMGAFSRGALCVVTKFPIVDDEGKNLPCIVCSDPLEEIVKISSRTKARVKAKTIAVTGSIGKTSTKEMIRLVTSEAFRTVYSRSNQNGFGQVVRYAQTLPDDVEVYIQETGISKPGSLSRAARILAPDAFVITNIGLNHVGYFGGLQEGILEEKLQLDVHASDDAVGFLNWDDPLLKGASYKHKIITYSVDTDDADYCAKDVLEKNGAVDFDVFERASLRKTHVSLQVVGKHNVGNALCAFAIGRWLGLDEETIAAALRNFKPSGVRQNLVYLGGQHVYLDCYNASEGAIASVAETMKKIDVAPGGKRVLVLGDIDDKLGARTEEVHRRVGKTLAQCGGIDLLICFGKHMLWAAEESGKLGLKVLATEERGQMEQWILENVNKEDLIAFKGGQQMLLTKTIDNLFGTPFFLLDGDMVSKLSSSLVDEGYRLRILEDYGVEVRGLESDFDPLSIVVPGRFDVGDVRLIGKSAFSGSELVKVTISEPIRAISQTAFFRSSLLEEVVLPQGLEYVGASAFNSCSSLRRIVIPESVKTIEYRAFAYCRTLREVVMPSGDVSLGEEAFLGSPHAKLLCMEGSEALRQCESMYPKQTAVIR